MKIDKLVEKLQSTKMPDEEVDELFSSLGKQMKRIW